jgi:hypothetical protein
LATELQLLNPPPQIGGKTRRKKMILGQRKQNSIESVFTLVNFSKASPEAVDAILHALNHEVELAISQNRFPSLDRAFSLLSPTSDLAM